MAVTVSGKSGVSSPTPGSSPGSQSVRDALGKTSASIGKPGSDGYSYRDFRNAVTDLYASELGLSKEELGKHFGEPPSFHRFHQAVLELAATKGKTGQVNALYWAVRAQQFGLGGKDAEAFVQNNLQQGNIDKDLHTEIKRCLQTTYQASSGLSLTGRERLKKLAQEALAPKPAAHGKELHLSAGDALDFRGTTTILNALESGHPVQVNGKTIPPAGRCRTVAFDPKARIDRHQRPTEIWVSSNTTAQAVIGAHQAPDDTKVIAVNFANERHCGGAPGYDYTGGRFVAGSSRSGAQEENLFEKTDLARSLMKNKDKLYPFNSTQQVYVSDNTLWATDKADPTGQGSASSDKESRVVDPHPVTFVTSAAKNYRGGVAPQGSWQQDMERRIDLQLQAAAKEAEKAHAQDQKSHVILGAFGCGAFAPSQPADYAKQVAKIYEKLLTTKYQGVFDKVEFALPSFAQGGGLEHKGKQSSAAMGDANYRQFNQVFPAKAGPVGIKV